MNNLKKVQRQIKIEKFLLDTIFEIFTNGIILFIAYISGKMLEVACIYVSWNLLRNVFPKVFHIKCKTPLKSIFGCAFVSILCYVISLTLTLSIHTSIYSSVVIEIILNYILYFICDYRDLLDEREKNKIDIYKMDEEHLRQYAKSKGVSETIIDTLVLRVINNYKWCEIMEERKYTKDGIRYHKEVLNKLLNVKL